MFQITFTAMTTEGPHSHTSDHLDGIGETLNAVAGVIAGVGEDNIIAINIVVV